MAKENRAQVADWIFKAEGGFTIRNTEAGGAGNRGISFARFKEWWALQNRPGEPTFDDLKNQSLEDATALYGEMFLKPAKFDDLPSGVDYAVYDAVVNGGGVKLLHKALGFKLDDSERKHGVIGPKTLWAARHRDPKDLINHFCDLRVDYVTHIRISNDPVDPKKGPRTWGEALTARTEVVRKRALAMVKT